MKQYTVKVFDSKTKWYNSDNQLDRDNGPAVEYIDGHKLWYKNGNRHRDGGPAVEYPNGDKCWYKNGIRHRDNGPAIEYASGDKEYYFEGIKCYKKDYYKKINFCKNKIIDGKKYTLIPM